LTGKEQFSINIREGNLKVHEQLTVTTNTGKSFNVKVRLDTDVEIEYFKNGGILQYMLRRLIKS
jgi:aconitate hydratase